MVSVVLLELTTEYTEYTEEENLTEYRRFAAYGISQKESVYGIRDTNFLGISVRFSSSVYSVYSVVNSSKTTLTIQRTL